MSSFSNNHQWSSPLSVVDLETDVDGDDEVNRAGWLANGFGVVGATAAVGLLALGGALVISKTGGSGEITETSPGDLAAVITDDTVVWGQEDDTADAASPASDDGTESVGANDAPASEDPSSSAPAGEEAGGEPSGGSSVDGVTAGNTAGDESSPPVTTPSVPTTAAPTTAAPATAAPTTAAPTTAAPATAAPTTAAPTTAAPATAAPTTAAPTTAAPTTAAPTTVAGNTLTAFRQELLVITNAERAKVGCPALVLHPNLNSAAQAHSEDMIARDYFAHRSPEGVSAGQRMASAGYDWMRWGENIAYGYPTPASVMNGWMNSPSHRGNILDCNFLEMGVGYANPNHYWTQVFGTR